MLARVISWILIVLLFLGFGLAALAKFSGAQDEMFLNWGYSLWFANFIGVVELIGAVLLLISKWRKVSILLLTVIMIGATYTHIANGETISVIRPATFAAMLWVVWALQFRETSVNTDSPG